MTTHDDAPWSASFTVTTDNSPGGQIRIDQIDKKRFKLGSTVTYIGAKTGLERLDERFGTGTDADRAIRVVAPEHLEPDTDLASVPGPVRWFMNSYGIHTPAALIHDRFIPAEGTVDGMTDQYADRYFRFMLDDLGVRWLKRWLMWAAVAFRTRNVSAKPLLIAWVLLAGVGIAAFIVGLVTSTWWLFVVAAVLPFPAARLWGRQWGASFVAAVGALFVIPPAIVAAAGYGVYLLFEWLAKLVGRR